MKYIATIRFESDTEPLDDCDQFGQSLIDQRYNVTDFNIEEETTDADPVPTTPSNA